MRTSMKFALAGLAVLVTAPMSPVYGQYPSPSPAMTWNNPNAGLQNCHLGTIRLVAPNASVPQYTPGYASDQQMINTLRINVNRGIPLNQVDIQQLRTPHVLAVPNGQGGFNHCAAAGPLSNGYNGIQQSFHTNPDHYQQKFGSGQDFLNQTVNFGGQSRQPYQGKGGNVQVYCPGGSCSQHPR